MTLKPFQSSYHFYLVYVCIFLTCYACQISDDLLIEEDQGAMMVDPNNPFPNAGSSGAGTNEAGTQNSTAGMSTTTGAGVSSMGCTVGESLGLCSICGPDKQAKMPDNDDQCPPINCESLSRYQVRELEDGGKICERYPFTQTGGNCEVLGLCVENPTLVCMEEPMVELLTWYPGCGEFIGCENNEPPSINTVAEGTECYSFGTCDQIGGCSVAQSCYGLDTTDGNEHCSSDINGCKVYTSARHYQNLEEITCRAYCIRGANRGCLDGWESNGACQEGSNIGCNSSRRDIVCLCEP